MPAPETGPFEIRTVAVIGAGTAGRSFAGACLRAGFDVALEDVMPANLRRAEAEFSELGGESVSGRLSLVLTVEDAVRDADIAVDFVPDELESKLEIFSMIDRMAPPRTVMCTPSDTQSITDLASCVYRPERCFAVRGGLAGDGGLRLLYAAAANAGILGAVEVFFRKLGSEVASEADPDVPALMKNLSPTVGVLPWNV